MKTMYIRVLTALAAIMTFAAGCSEEDGPMKWVDLRYDVPQDSYVVDAKGEQTVTIRVKSTDPWEVFGNNREDWYEITPDKGGPGEIFIVTVRCHENTELDDRADTINVKSDYWTGKQFLLTQKGTAYLDFKGPEVIDMEGSPVTLSVLTNQNWKASVTGGGEWLSITEGAGGNGDGSVTLSASKNSGEMRYGEVTLYDRRDVPMHKVTVTQDGVLLSPASPENGKWFVLYEEAQQLRIPVEANASWTVAKEKPDDETWYEIETVSYDGSAELVINVSEYAKGGSPAVRTGTLVLSSVAAEGVTPVVKKVRFKQASPDENRTQAYPGGALDAVGITSSEGQQPGKYTFYLAPFDASTCIYLYFMWQRDGVSFAELRFWLNTSFAPMKTELSCMPYCNDVNKWQNNLLVPFDNTKQVKIAMDISESAPDADGNTWIYSEWWLNDKLIAKATSDGIADKDGVTDTWRVPFSDISAGCFFRLWAFTGAGTLEKWEYTSPLVWGE